MMARATSSASSGLRLMSRLGHRHQRRHIHRGYFGGQHLLLMSSLPACNTGAAFQSVTYERVFQTSATPAEADAKKETSDKATVPDKAIGKYDWFGASSAEFKGKETSDKTSIPDKAIGDNDWFGVSIAEFKGTETSDKASVPDKAIGKYDWFGASSAEFKELKQSDAKKETSDKASIPDKVIGKYDWFGVSSVDFKGK